jgi:DNA-binding NarL/FixJ family response regulator
MKAIESLLTDKWREKTAAIEGRISDTFKSRLALIKVGRHDKLAPREVQVLQDMLQGLRGPEIAKRRHISVKTVVTYRHRILEKLELKRPADLFYYAMMLAGDR